LQSIQKNITKHKIKSTQPHPTQKTPSWVQPKLEKKTKVVMETGLSLKYKIKIFGGHRLEYLSGAINYPRTLHGTSNPYPTQTSPPNCT